MNNEMILACVIVARQKIDHGVSEDDIRAVCSANNISYDIVHQIVDDATGESQIQDVVNATLQTLVTIGIAKSKDSDDEDLKDLTVSYANFISSANKLMERFAEQSGEIITKFNDSFNQLLIARGENS